MHGSELEGEQHCTAPRPRPWLRVIVSLAILGFLLGLMIGRSLQPPLLRLQQVEVEGAGLSLWFNQKPWGISESRELGRYALSLPSLGRDQQGQLLLHGRPVNWRVSKSGGRLHLQLVAARPLAGQWTLTPLEGRWRLRVELTQD